MDTLDDLLSKRRRGALEAGEARRLDVALQSSREYLLALRAGDGFDAEGAAAPGDAELMRRLASEVEGRWFGRSGSSPRRRRVVPLASALLFAAGAAAASYGGYRALDAFGLASVAPPAPAAPRAVRLEPREKTAAAPVEVMPARDGDVVLPNPRASSGESATATRDVREASRPTLEKASPGLLAVRARPAPTHVEAQVRRERVDETEREIDPETATAEPEHRLERHRALDGGERDPEPSSSASPAVIARGGNAARLVEDPRREREASPPPQPHARFDSPAALFERAQRLRQSDWAAAEVLYWRITDEHPASHEAGVAEMVLGKRALATGHERDALIWFRAHERRPGTPLAAEALWGQARALEALGRRADARAVWRRLFERHPSSPYARVARQRAAE